MLRGVECRCAACTTKRERQAELYGRLRESAVQVAAMPLADREAMLGAAGAAGQASARGRGLDRRSDRTLRRLRLHGGRAASRGPRFRADRGGARGFGPLGRDRRRPYRQLPDHHAHGLERLATRFGRDPRPLGAGADRHAGRRSGEPGRGRIRRALVRSVSGVHDSPAPAFCRFRLASRSDSRRGRSSSWRFKVWGRVANRRTHGEAGAVAGGVRLGCRPMGRNR